MARNRPTGDNRRVGAVTGRSQFQFNGNWFKRNTETGRIMGGKPSPWKGVAREPDGRSD